MGRFRRVTDDELVSMIQQELSQAVGFDGDELSSLREDALDYYYGEKPKAPGDGGSGVVSTDVADMIEAIVAQMMPAISSDNVVEFEAQTEQEVDQVQTESDLVNWLVMEENRGFIEIQSAVRDALMLRNGWIKVWFEDEDEVMVQRFPAQPAEVLAAVQGIPAQPGVSDISVEFEPVRDQDELFDIEVKITRNRRRIRVRSIDCTLMSWSQNWDSPFLEGIRFLAERRWETRSDLILAGYPKKIVNDLPAGESESATAGDTSSRYTRPGGGGFSGVSPGAEDVPDRSMQQIDTYVCYYMVDRDGDGIAEQHKVVMAGSKILDDEIVPFIPYANGTAFLQAHQLNGLSVYDKLRQTQDVKTAALRNWLNNQRAVNNSRVAVNEMSVNMEDAVSSRPGGAVRVQGDVTAAIMPFPIVDIGDSTLALLGYADKMRTEGGGASLELQTVGQLNSGQTAHGVERQMGSKEMLVAMMTRTLAETLIRSTWLLAHRALRHWQDEPLNASIRGQFVQSAPAQWPQRDRVNMKTGLSIGERVERRSALEAIIGQQTVMMQNGLDGVLTDLPSVYNAHIDWTRAAMIDAGERYFVDPRSEEAQAAGQQKQSQAQQDQDFQKQLAEQVATAEQQKETISAMMDKYQSDQETAYRYFEAILKAAVEEMKQGLPNEVDELQAFGGVKSITAD